MSATSPIQSRIRGSLGGGLQEVRAGPGSGGSSPCRRRSPGPGRPSSGRRPGSSATRGPSPSAGLHVAGIGLAGSVDGVGSDMAMGRSIDARGRPRRGTGRAIRRPRPFGILPDRQPEAEADLDGAEGPGPARVSVAPVDELAVERRAALPELDVPARVEHGQDAVADDHHRHSSRQSSADHGDLRSCRRADAPGSVRPGSGRARPGDVLFDVLGHRGQAGRGSRP